MNLLYSNVRRNIDDSIDALCAGERDGEMMQIGGDRSSPVEPLPGMSKQMPQCRDASIKEIDPELVNSSNDHWGKGRSELAAMVEEKLGNEHASRSG